MGYLTGTVFQTLDVAQIYILGEDALHIYILVVDVSLPDIFFDIWLKLLHFQT